LNNTDKKVVIQWFKRDDIGAPPLDWGDAPFDVGILTYDRIKISFLVLEVVVMKVMSMSEILARILGGIIFSISILYIIFSTDFHFGYQ
jgi:hypothetical protein